MEKFQEMLTKRHSIRKYTDEALSADEVKMILEAGLLAPTSKSGRPWEFVVIEDKNKLQVLSQCKKFGAVSLKTCALAVAICADPAKSDVWIEDTSVAAAFMHLQAEALGLGCCWVQLRNRISLDETLSAEDYVKDNLNIPSDLRVPCLLTFGHKNEERRQVDLEKLLWEKVHIGAYSKAEEE